MGVFDKEFVEPRHSLRVSHPDGLSGQSFYEILEIGSDASKLQIREAFIRLKNTYSHGNQALYSLISEQDARESLDGLEEISCAL